METDPKVTPSQQSVPAAEQDSVKQFLHEVKSFFPVERVKSELRATPKGVFVHKDFVDPVVKAYQEWLQKITGGEIEKSETKCIRRLFGTNSPPLLYLVEQKRALVGHLIESPLPQPQATGLPTFLGSLDDASRSLHPRDPLLLCMPHVSVSQSQGEIRIETKDATGRPVRFSTRFLVSFAKTAVGARQYRERFSGEEPALRDALKVLLETLPQFRPPRPNQRLLVPEEAVGRRDTAFMVHGSIVFVSDKDGTLVRCFDREGRGLLYFIKRECEALGRNPKRRRIGALTLLPPQRKEIASCRVSTTEYRISLHAVVSFVRLVQHDAPEGRREWVRYGIGQCLEEMGDLLVRAEPIDRRKIERHLSKNASPKYRYLINQRYIFAVGQGSVVLDVIDKAGKKPAGR